SGPSPRSSGRMTSSPACGQNSTPSTTSRNRPSRRPDMPQPNIQNMLKQAQEVMAAQQEAQDALKEQRVEASAGGGMVKVVVSGDLKMESLTIEPDAVDPEDVEMLQDLVLAATNEALRQVVDLQEKAMQAASGPGGFDPMSALE